MPALRHAHTQSCPTYQDANTSKLALGDAIAVHYQDLRQALVAALVLAEKLGNSALHVLCLHRGEQCTMCGTHHTVTTQSHAVYQQGVLPGLGLHHAARCILGPLIVHGAHHRGHRGVGAPGGTVGQIRTWREQGAGRVSMEATTHEQQGCTHQLSQNNNTHRAA